jgi:hypothetical protein
MRGGFVGGDPCAARLSFPALEVLILIVERVSGGFRRLKSQSRFALPARGQLHLWGYENKFLAGVSLRGFALARKSLPKGSL